MADLAASDVTYSFDLKDAMWVGRKGKLFRGTITFGDGSKTLPSGGLPLTKGNMGCPQKITSLKVMESNAAGYLYEYDFSAEKLRLFRAGAESGSISSNSAGTPAGNVAINVADSGGTPADLNTAIFAANNQFEANTTGATINTGITFTGDALGTHSHTFTGTAASFSEATGVAVAAQVLEVEVVGY